jgi:alanine racemase
VSLRPAWAEVDVARIGHNVARLRSAAEPADLCVVVKAGAYGHGAVPVARAALAAGASWLAVALVDEGAELREAGIDAPVLLLSEPPADAMGDAVALGLTPTVYTEAGVAAAAAAAAGVGAGGGAGAGRRPAAVHLKVDTGMHRVGAAPTDAVKLAITVEERPELDLQGVWTHFAVADDPGDPFTAVQHRRFEAVLAELARHGLAPPIVHASNSAATLAFPAGRHDMVRCGLAVYGLAPSPALAERADLLPALALKARVSFVHEVGAGDGLSYGLRYRLDSRATVATVPIGYADGVPWRLAGAGGEVLVGARRRPIAGAVTMDQILVDCGDDTSVAAGDEVVLLGDAGGESVGAWEWATRVGTIPYEVLCGIGPRVPRVYV